jgi:chromosome partitioning protein
MIVTIANFKGSGRRTTAIHLAAFMQTLGPTILADGDIVRASSKWAARGDDKGMPFKRSPSANLHELVEWR